MHKHWAHAVNFELAEYRLYVCTFNAARQTVKDANERTTGFFTPVDIQKIAVIEFNSLGY